MLVLLLIFAGLAIWWLNWSLYWWKRGVPYFIPLPVLGNCISIFKEGSYNFYTRLYNTFPRSPHLGFFLSTRPVLLLKDPEVIIEVLEKKAAIFSSHGIDIDKGFDPMARSLFLLQGTEWKEIRSVLSPHFGPSKAKMLGEVSKKSGKRLVEYIHSQIINSKSGDGSELIDMKKVAQFYTVDSTSLSLFGVESKVFQDGKNSQFYRVARDLVISVPKVILNFISPRIYNSLKLILFSSSAKNFIDNLMEATMKSRRMSPLTRPDFIQDLMKFVDNNKGYDESVIVSQGAVLFAGGIETTATTLAFAIYELALNQDLQKELRNNIKTDEGQDLLKLVIGETLRKYPVFMTLSRSNTVPCTLSTGITLDKNTLIVIPVYTLHRDPMIFSNPNKFDPYRQKMRGAYLPFGLGPRVCIGMRLAQVNLQNVLTSLLENFRFTPVVGCEDPVELNNHIFSSLPVREGALKVIVHRLDKSMNYS